MAPDTPPAASQRFDVAVVGATGLVGEALLAVLEEREFPIGKLYALGSERSAEETLAFAGRSHRVRLLDDFDFSRCQLVFFCTPAAVAAAHIGRALAAGCRVIDLSAHARSDARAQPQVADLVETLPADCSLLAAASAPALQLATVLAPLHPAGIERVAVTTLLAVSARGRRGIAELAGQTARLLNAQSIEPAVFPAQIAFNTLPVFDAIGESGYTDEELRLGAELRSIFGDAQLEVVSTQMFVPVFYGHTQIVQIETRDALSLAVARKALTAARGIRLLRKDQHLTPVGCSGEDERIAVGRLAQAAGDKHRLTFWSVADNIRKGAAVNTVLLAENLIKNLS